MARGGSMEHALSITIGAVADTSDNDKGETILRIAAKVTELSTWRVLAPAYGQSAITSVSSHMDLRP
eukprot:4874528-Amphidinium_carterae.1